MGNLHQSAHGDQNSHGETSHGDSRKRGIVKMCKRPTCVRSCFIVGIVLIEVDLRAQTKTLHLYGGHWLVLDLGKGESEESLLSVVEKKRAVYEGSVAGK
jgi:hypothetical protein